MEVMRNPKDCKIPKILSIILTIGLMVVDLSSVPVYASASKGTVEERRDLILSIMEELETL